MKDMAQKNKVVDEAVKNTIARTTASTMTSLQSASGCHSSYSSQNEVFIRAVLEHIRDVLRMYPRWNTNKRTGSLIAQAVWSQQSNLLELLKLSRRHFQDNVVTPYNVLREMDLAATSGNVSFEGIDAL